MSYSIYYSKNKNKKNSRPKRIWMKPWLKNRNKKSAYANIFSEFPLTEKFRHCLRMNATSYYWPYTDFYTSINYIFHITYTYNYEICIHYFYIYWFLKFTAVHVFNFYKITSSPLRNQNNRINDAWGGFFLKKYFTEQIF